MLPGYNARMGSNIIVLQLVLSKTIIYWK